MLDDYKYSIGRLVVYEHANPKLPRQSYGHYGHEKTLGEILAVDVAPTPHPRWIYTIRNVRNQEITRVDESQIRFATAAVGRQIRGRNKRVADKRMEDCALAEMIAKALSNPERAVMLNSSLRELMMKEESATRAAREGANLPIGVGDYVSLRGDMRRESEHLHNHYAKIIAVEPADVAGIENPHSKPGQPRMWRTLKVYKVVTSEGVQSDVYDAEIKLFYTANSRKTILNWRAATLLAEAFGDNPPYKVEYEYLAEHVFAREELEKKSRAELANMLATMLYVKGKMGWRDYQRRSQYFAATPRSHMIDSLLEVSRFDARRNRSMTPDEIVRRKQDSYKLRRLLKS